METFKEYLATVNTPEHKERMSTILDWVLKTYPQLEGKIAYNQPMFTDHGTFIISFSLANKHIAVAPERQGILALSELIHESGYEHSKMLIRIPWDKAVDYEMLSKIIEYNMMDKKGVTTFWRK